MLTRGVEALTDFPIATSACAMAKHGDTVDPTEALGMNFLVRPKRTRGIGETAMIAAHNLKTAVRGHSRAPIIELPLTMRLTTAPASRAGPVDLIEVMKRVLSARERT